MKSKLSIMIITILLILVNTVPVFADTETTVTLEASSTEVKAGETFTVTLKATCPDGINGIETTYSYDTEKLEFVKGEIANSKFVSMGEDNAINVMSTATESIQSADIWTLTFTVKEGITAGSTATISIDETYLSSDAEENYEHTIPAQEVTVTVIDTVTGDEGTGDEGTGDEGTGDEGTGDEGTGDEGTGNEGTGTDENEEQPTTEGTTVVVGDDEKDDTTATTEIPKAGLNTMLVMGIVAIVIVAVIMYRKNKKYEDIK